MGLMESPTILRGAHRRVGKRPPNCGCKNALDHRILILLVEVGNISFPLEETVPQVSRGVRCSSCTTRPSCHGNCHCIHRRCCCSR